jgi:hypothetical protein
MGSFLHSAGGWRPPRIRAAVGRGGAARPSRARCCAAVTVRRLADEVNWVLEARDVCGADARLDPPPLDSVLVSPVVAQVAATSTAAAATAAEATSAAAAATSAAIVQIGAHAPLQTLVTKFDTGRRAAFEVCDVEVQFTAPVSVALVREALDAYAEPGAPRWLALERVLQHVIAYWEAHPAAPRPDLRARRLAVHRPGLQLAPQPARPSPPVPVARWQQRARESHRGLRGASPARVFTPAPFARRERRRATSSGSSAFARAGRPSSRTSAIGGAPTSGGRTRPARRRRLAEPLSLPLRLLPARRCGDAGRKLELEDSRRRTSDREPVSVDAERG